MTAKNNLPFALDIFDPDGVGIRNGNYFGMPFSPEAAALVLVSVPWDVTSSYGGGAAAAPETIMEESTQLDFYDPWAPGEWRKGIATLSIDLSIAEKSALLRGDARRIIEALEAGCNHENTQDSTPCIPECAPCDYCGPVSSSDSALLKNINTASAELNAQIYTVAKEWLSRGKIVGLVGGDHSTPYALIRAVAEHENPMCVLHLDAHCDLRPAYEGFENSHASIRFNVLRDVPQIEKLVQVGIRDFSEAEYKFARNHPKIKQFAGSELSENEFRGETWSAQCDRIIQALSENVYVSFDIDFLSPEYCPGTGTPVPGGRSFDEAAFLLRRVVDSGRRIVGFDLCEVAPNPANQSNIDANVGARMLFKLCGQALRTAKSAK